MADTADLVVIEKFKNSFHIARVRRKEICLLLLEIYYLRPSSPAREPPGRHASHKRNETNELSMRQILLARFSSGWSEKTWLDHIFACRIARLEENYTDELGLGTSM
jgi:hypothetical protein